MSVTRRGFLKSLALIGVAGYVSPKFVYDSFKRDYVSELHAKLTPIQRWTDGALTHRGIENLLFRGYPVTNDIVEGSIWSNDWPVDQLKRVREARNELVRFLS